MKSDDSSPAFSPLLGQRVMLRLLDIGDAADTQRMAGDPAIADTTLSLPHPYLDGMAETWIAGNQENYGRGVYTTLGIAKLEDGSLLGAIAIKLSAKPFDSNGEIGYWIGKEHWGKGYCTEAAQLIVRHGFETLGLNRIYAIHMTRNPASGRVMQKIGMQYEGCMRQLACKNGVFEDFNMYAILKQDWLSRR